MVEAEPARPRPVGPPARCAQVTPDQRGASGQRNRGRGGLSGTSLCSLSLLSQIVVKCTCETTKNVHVLTDSCAAHVVQWSRFG